MKILFFIGALEAGGRERRLIELLSYLKNNTSYNLMLVLRRNKIEYPFFKDLEITHKILNDDYKKGDITLPFRFYMICKKYKPDIIHVWGNMPAFVSLLAVILNRTPLINNQISDAPPSINNFEKIINKINFMFSDTVLANTYAGLKAYGVDSLKKCSVIYNGVDINRFRNLPDIYDIKLKYNITTPYAVVMSASFTKLKNNDLFYKVAEIVTSNRSDTTFIGIGGSGMENSVKYDRLVLLAKNNSKILFPGRINDVEALVNACDIGILFSNKQVHGEGISNAIIEYMALSKPVIANDAGGTKEIVKQGINGYLVEDEQPGEIAILINNLLDDKRKRQLMGEAGRSLIYDYFTIERMGKEFLRVYENTLR